MKRPKPVEVAPERRTSDVRLGRHAMQQLVNRSTLSTTIDSPHGVTSNASSRIQASVASGFLPITWIVNVCVPAARPLAVKSVC